MNINLPDRIYKLLVLIGIALVSYSFFEIDSRNNSFDKAFRANLDLLDAATQSASELTIQINDLKIQGYSIAEYQRRKLNLTTQRDFQREKIKHVMEARDHEYKMYQTKTSLFKVLLFTGVLILLTGAVFWVNDENKTLKTIVRQDERLYECCQSCGKRFSSVRVNGSRADGSANNAFCKECYDEGEFANPSLTKDEVLAATSASIGKKGWFKRKAILARIENLDRWKGNADEY